MQKYFDIINMSIVFFSIFYFLFDWEFLSCLQTYSVGNYFVLHKRIDFVAFAKTGQGCQTVDRQCLELFAHFLDYFQS